MAAKLRVQHELSTCEFLQKLNQPLLDIMQTNVDRRMIQDEYYYRQAVHPGRHGLSNSRSRWVLQLTLALASAPFVLYQPLTVLYFLRHVSIPTTRFEVAAGAPNSVALLFNFTRGLCDVEAFQPLSLLPVNYRDPVVMCHLIFQVRFPLIRQRRGSRYKGKDWTGSTHRQDIEACCTPSWE